MLLGPELCLALWAAGGAACRDVGTPAAVVSDTTASRAGSLGLADRWVVGVSDLIPPGSTIDGLMPLLSRVGADAQRAYVAADTTLTAVDLATGQVAWHSTALAGPGAAPASDGRLVVHAAALVTALDAATGAIVWRADAGASAGATTPLLDDASVYVGTGGFAAGAARVVAYARSTGAPRWTAPVGQGWAYRGSVSGLAAADGVLYATATQCVVATCGALVSWVIALDPATGVERWRSRLGDGAGQVFVVAAPAVDAQRLYLNDFTGNEVFALDRVTHRLAWTAAFRPGYYGPSSPPPPVDARGRLYAASGDGSVAAFDARSGATVWKVTPRGSFADLVRCGGGLVARRRPGLVALDPGDGRVFATRFDTGEDAAESNLVVSGNVLVVATSHGLRAFTCA